MLAKFATAQNPNPVADTANLTLDSAENIFLKNNLQLLAQRYNVSAQKALVIQAKLIPNPNFSYSQAPIGTTKNPQSNFFSNNEIQAGISELIILARKRDKQIKLAEANAQLSEYQLFDLIKTLKYTLRTDFFNIYYLRQSLKLYDKEIASLKQVANAFNLQQGKGYISEKEVIRIKAQLYSLQNEYNGLMNELNDVESELRVVLQVKNIFIVPLVNELKISAYSPSQYSLATLIDTAYKNRPDLQIAKANTGISKLNYNYQKALAVPDLTGMVNYDKQGSYATNLFSIGIAIDLPLFNRNQGNIQSAKSMIDYNAANQKSAEAQAEEQIYRALQKVYDNDKLYKNIDEKFLNDFSRLLDEVLDNYQKRNIGLLDFLDFYDSYKQNVLQLNSIKLNRINAFEDLNFYTATNFFN
jgi:cobalt-zinc-cadmium efflux system outer membrane protein